MVMKLASVLRIFLLVFMLHFMALQHYLQELLLIVLALINVGILLHVLTL